MADDDPTKGDPVKGDPDDLGDAGKKALDAERKARREAEASIKKLHDRLEELEGKDKGDVERLTAKLTAAEKRADDAESKALRLEVAAEKGVKARWLSGNTREELEAAADEYLADHPKPETSTTDKSGDKPPAKPREDLKGGGDPTADGPVDVRQVVESIPRGI